MSYLITKDLEDKDKQLLERISRAIRRAPAAFLEGGRVLDKYYSPEAFRRRRAGELLGYKKSRDIDLELRQRVVSFVEEREGVTALDLVEHLPSFQHPASAERVLEELVQAGLARWVDREAAEDSHPIERRQCQLTERALGGPLPYLSRKPIVRNILMDWHWKRTKVGDSPSPHVSHRLATASHELASVMGLPSRENAKAICAIAWLASDPNAHEFMPRICHFQEVPWLPDFEGGKSDARCFNALLEPVAGRCELLTAARDSVERLKTLAVWPPTEKSDANATSCPQDGKPTATTTTGSDEEKPEQEPHVPKHPPIPVHLDATDEAILGLLERAGGDRLITPDIAKMLSRSPKSIGKNLSKLKKANLIENPGRAGYAKTQQHRPKADPLSPS